MGSDCMSLALDGSRISVGAACATEQPAIVGSHVLLAVGRRPNTDGLGLDNAGVLTDAHGHITVDDQCRTSADGVWALSPSRLHSVAPPKVKFQGRRVVR